MRHAWTATLLLGLLCTPALAEPPTPEQIQLFESRVRPVLVMHCQKCHGPAKQQSGLRLDTKAALLVGGDSGPVVVPGKPEESPLIEAINHAGLKMPPKEKLPADAIAALTDWVRQGAPWPDERIISKKPSLEEARRTHWAFQPVRPPTPPAVTDTAWPLNDVDRFIRAALDARGLKPVELADKATLLRRVTFDLTGLPPTPEEVRAFLADPSPVAYSRVVERLLASPAYGERWGRHWLDVVRYADTAGDNSDYPIPQLYLYRNYVIRAFNADRPYDQFLLEQLAGDLLPHRDEEERRMHVIATGYLGNARRFGSYEDARYQWYLTYEDTIDNLGKALLGLTVSCARCHDHKFDPIPTEDYYALYGFFQSTRFPWPGVELDKMQRDLVPLLPPEEAEPLLREREQRLTELEDEIQRLSKEQATADQARREQLKKQIVNVRNRKEKLGQQPLPFPTAYAVAEGTRRVGSARMQLRGDPEKPGKEVPRRFLSVLGGQTLPSETQGSGRLHLARWLVDPANPLTARVFVNRLWQHHFGKGLVATPNDFGKQGHKPSHPELLDYLANRFVADGWSIKAMHRLLVQSRIYQLASHDDPVNRQIDPTNDYLWRYTPRRLDAEALRDSLLAISGKLDRSEGGPHPFPHPTTWDFTQHKPFKAVYESQRRSVYLMTQRIQRHPYLALFDGADTNASTAARVTSTTPLQALYLMNDSFVHDQARAFANRLRREAADETARIERAHLLAFGRLPTATELRLSQEYLEKARSWLGAADEDAAAWESYARALLLRNDLVYLH